MCHKLDKEVRVRVKLDGQLTASSACISMQITRFLAKLPARVYMLAEAISCPLAE